MRLGLQLGPISAFVVDQQGCKDCFQHLLCPGSLLKPPTNLSTTSLEIFTSVVAMTQLSDGEVAPGPHSPTSGSAGLQACGLQVEQGTASWWGMGFLWGLAQVQIEFIFLWQSASSSQPPSPT